ncbi:hypothetical protein FY036_04525 [Mesorhizobium microcysteis]|uniref:Uncharacterized protein n=1 Tax=Neoaquamicrobium microcysteis TaxID=2682781 RepID=A0A5D4H2Z2_9HYPH|nr:hypothetical protein [Mesorhizobium microcysteis]TYR34623.1 hypothetical protein FY036_04525 [Mesorhizobium microcysteis]
MRQTIATLAALLFSAAPAFAESYTAVSNTAMSITGDIELDETGITFANGKTMAFSEKAADNLTIDGRARQASVYRVENPDDPTLESGNELCGNGDVTFIAAWEGSYGLTSLAVFTGDMPPESDESMCASYSYQATR